MQYAQNIRNFLSKKDYDFDRADITLSNFHSQLYTTLAAEGIFFGNRDSYLRFLIPLSSIGVTFVGVAFEGLNIYVGVSTSDYSRACESFCYLVILCSIITVYSGFLLKRAEIFHLVEEMETDFEQICSFGPRYREPFLESQLLVWKLFVSWTAFVIVCGGLFFLYPCILLVYQSLLATQDEYTTRPLVFPLWLPNDDPYRTPNYEMLFVLESWYIFAFILCFGGYVYTLFHFLLHYYIMMDMIILDFEVIFDGLDESVAYLAKNDPRRVAVHSTLKRRFGRIVTWHHSVYRAIKTVSSIFRPSLIYQVMLSSVAICLIAYQIADKLDRGEFDLLFTFLGAAAVLQLWIPCYLGTILRNKVPPLFAQKCKVLSIGARLQVCQSSTGYILGFAVGDACWECGWHSTPLGCMVRTELVLILLRAKMPIFIKYTGQPVIQLETFSAIMSSSYSYFNMLRQSAK